MKLERESLSLLNEALDTLESGFSGLPDFAPDIDMDALRSVVLAAAERMQDNYPYFHPYYAGQMLKPPHPVARLAYMLSLWINPNNHALDGGRASSAMEKEAVARIARMFDWQTHLGHLCSGGTMANLEALWIAGQVNPGKKIVASEQAHYTHNRISAVLKLDFEAVACDENARIDLDALESVLKKGNVGTVVATIGTTATGSLDPLPSLLKLKEKYGFRIHADAAYGGYFTLVDSLDEYAQSVYAGLSEVDSLVIDPHKHGLQPYGCGCILFRDPSVGAFYKHDSPYTYFSSNELHLGEISLECSRPGAAAVALWTTQQMLPMTRDGEFAGGLTECRKAALAMYDRLCADSRVMTLFKPELDIVIWAPEAESISRISGLSQKIFTTAADYDLHLAVFGYPSRQVQKLWPDVEIDADQVTLLRACMMKPEHNAWIDNLWNVLDKVMREVSGE